MEKSEQAKKLAVGYDAEIFSSDALRTEMFGDVNHQKDNDVLFKELQKEAAILQYKLIGSNDTNHIIQTVLNNRGIDDWQEYLTLDSIDEEEYKGLDNIDQAIECFVSHIERGNEVGILFDTDT